MKKLAVLFVVVLLIVLSACSRQNNALLDVDYETYDSNVISIVTDKEIYSSDVAKISYKIKNVSDEEAFINSDDSCFSIHKLVDGEWKLVATKTEHCWTEVALALPPNQVEEREINLSDYYNLPLEKGEYRIVVEGIASNTFEID